MRAREPFQPSVETFLVFNHGTFEGGLRTEATGEAARKVVADGRRLQDYDDLDLLGEGWHQAEQIHQGVGDLAIDACLCSPTRRTHSTAEVVLGDRDVAIETTPGLYERDRGIFAFMPSVWANNHPAYRIGKESTLGWLPEGGQCLLELVDMQYRVLQQADRLAPGGCVALSTHNEAMVALRAAARFAAMTDERFRLPLVPNPPANNRALQCINWVAPAQRDYWTRRNPHTNRLSSVITHFRSVGVAEPVFDTGWLRIRSGCN